MNRKLVFWTAFNTFRSDRATRLLPPGSPHPVTTLEWTQRRVDLFNKFNLPSILNQSYSDFLYIVLLDPNLRDLTEPLFSKMDDRVILCYQDAPGLAIISRYDEIVLALIDSDDLYSRHAGEIMMDKKNREWMYFRKGYSFDYLRGRLYHYDTIWSGPFFAHRINPRLMIRFDREKQNPSHKAVKRNYNPQELPPGNFCVLIHDRNTSSHAGMRNILHRAENRILKEEFGI